MTEAENIELAISIVHYHAEEFLKACIESLERSTWKSFKAVVVDNGSTTDLAWVEDDPRFALIRPGSNLGFAAGTNRALQQLPTTAPLVLSLNPDVALEPDILEKMVGFMKTNPSVGAATCRVLLPSGRLDPACRRSEPTPWSAICKQLGLSRLAPNNKRLNAYNLGHLDPSKSHPIDAGTGAFLMIRRSALDTCGGQLDERFFLYGEDLDLCRRLRESGHSLLYTPAVSVVHHKGSGRIRAARVTFHFYRAMWLYWRKWSPSRNNPILLATMLLALGGLGTSEIIRNEGKRLLGRPLRRSASIPK